MSLTADLNRSARSAPAHRPTVWDVPAASATGSEVLAVEDLVVRRDDVRLVDSVSLAVRAGETLCLVGESGCGKSLTCMAMLGLTDRPLVADGSIRLLGQEILGVPERKLNALRGRRAAMVFQNPMVALNPIKRVGAQIEEVLRLHTGLTASQRQAEVAELLARVGLPDPVRLAQAYPHQLSGGMCQRAMIAMAIACKPALLIADEPTTALDVTIQAQILSLLRDLQRETGMALVFVTHDLGVVAEMADRVAVMYSGRVVEEGSADEIFDCPQHPYTRALMGCRIDAGSFPGRMLPAIAGTVPLPAARPSGCAFGPRCGEASATCEAVPVLPGRPGAAHRVACHARRLAE